MSPLIGGECYWMDSAPAGDYGQLTTDLDVDVCVVGAGMTGLLTAWELLDAGLRVAVLDSRAVASAVTGYTTSKLTSQHGLKYSGIEHRQGAKAARWYGEANERALRRIGQIATELGVDADIERRDAYVYGGRAETADMLREEAEAAVRAGMPAVFTREAPLPYPTFGAVVFADQVQFHPRKLLLGIAAGFVQRGGIVHEHTKVTEVTAADAGGRQAAVATEAGHTVRADHVVLATLLPSPLGGELRKHLYCHQGYAVALPVLEDPLPDGMFINADRPMRSLRSIPTDEGRLLQVGGSAYVDDPNSGNTPWDDLEAWGREHFAGADAATWRWTTQDYSSADGIPLIGRLTGDVAAFVATGFGGWGLTTAGVAAELIRQQVTEGPADWHVIFDPTRELPVADTRIISSHRRGLGVAPERALSELGEDCAIVLEVDGEEVAAYRDSDGKLHRVSAACTHLGCIVLWERDDRQWNCPCHGSRFAPDGAVVKGPAREALPPR